LLGNRIEMGHVELFSLRETILHVFFRGALCAQNRNQDLSFSRVVDKRTHVHKASVYAVAWNSKFAKFLPMNVSESLINAVNHYQIDTIL